MTVEKGDIVESANGRDKGRALFVLEVDDQYLILTDGKRRRVEHPKRKKTKHCVFLARGDCRVALKIKEEKKVANSEIRRALAAFAAGAGEMTGGGL
ncbi:MAG: KOW domain-containing RNA-binding protein [Oscillospiraceae bacterium]|nr:KOW domain-containing RNA-binding protein [Oscillospiraceae bacterium]